MLNKLDLKNFDKVIDPFNFEELVLQETAQEIALIVFNKVRYQFTQGQIGKETLAPLH